MKFASFQPYFFPYLGYFHLINSVDKWIISDDLQYIRNGWINRNRILHPSQGWSYIIVPIQSHPYTIRIKDVRIAPVKGWRERIIRKLLHYKRHAPQFEATLKLVEECLDNETSSIAELNTSILIRVCAKLGVRFDYVLESELNLPVVDGESHSDNICAKAHAVGADEYLNPPGGAHLYQVDRFAELGVKLTIHPYINMTYATGKYAFEPALSIIDVMMWNSAAEIREHLEQG